MPHLSVPAAVAALLLLLPATATAKGRIADRCLTLDTGRYVAADSHGYLANAGRRKAATRFHLKPTALHTYLLRDDGGRLLAVDEDGAVARTGEAGPAAEWRIRSKRRRVVIRSAQSGRVLRVDRASRRLVTGQGDGRLFRLRRARGCDRFPEAELNVKRVRTKKRKRGLWGLADAHFHPTADQRAGGNVIYGRPFHPFGIPEALGHDHQAHGPDGALDVTGNLLRDGSPAGTHDTDGWPAFSGWPVRDTYTHQQAYYRWLQRAWRAGWRLVVAQTVEDEPLCRIEPLRTQSCDEMEIVELQAESLRGLQDYVDAHHGGRGRGWFRLVHSPAEAARVIRQGKLAVVIGAETSNPFGCSQFRGLPNCDRAKIDAGLERMWRAGVRSMFVAHWVDNALSGAALEGGDKGLFIAAMQVEYTGEPFSTGPCPLPDQGEEVATEPGAGKRCNTKGLTELGEYAVNRMMDRGMLIEVDHMSELARARILEIARERDYPLVSSHTGTGGPWNDIELKELYARGGMATAKLDRSKQLAERIMELRALQERHAGISLATDAGGFAALPAPEDDAPVSYPFTSIGGDQRLSRQQTGERTFDVNVDGVAHYGLIPDHLSRVERRPQGRRALKLLFGSARAYVRTWRRTGLR